jgi:hypothetical protein
MVGTMANLVEEAPCAPPVSRFGHGARQIYKIEGFQSILGQIKGVLNSSFATSSRVSSKRVDLRASPRDGPDRAASRFAGALRNASIGNKHLCGGRRTRLAL